MKLLLKEELGFTPAGSDDASNLGSLMKESVERTLACQPEDAADILEKGLQTRQSRHGDTAELLDLLDLPFFKEVIMSKEDTKTVDDALKTAKASEKRTASVVKTIRALRSSVSKVPPKVRRKPVQFQSDRSWAVEHVQQLLPKGHYRAYRDSFNGCWRIFGRYGWSLSRSWGAAGKDAPIVRELLVAVWRRHESLHPVECPWSFDDLS